MRVCQGRRVLGRRGGRCCDVCVCGIEDEICEGLSCFNCCVSVCVYAENADRAARKAVVDTVCGIAGVLCNFDDFYGCFRRELLVRRRKN